MNVVESIINLLRTPIAKRKGVTISTEDCAIWAEELEKYWENMRQRLKTAENKVYDLEHNK